MKQSGDESRFHLMERLGRGGTAEVFRVRVGTSGREAALKRPLPVPEPGIDFHLLASRELSLIGTRRFPGLVRILNGPDDSTDYLLLEICEGKTLDQLGRITDLALALNLLSAVAADLEYLRQLKIIHGDLKPQNIFLPVELDRCKSDKLFFAKLSDFSLGRYEYEPDTVRVGLGTVGYMAPETIIDSRASHLSDLFALGVIAYQMLTGKHPFIGSETDPMLINARVREEEPLPLDQLAPSVSKPLADLVTSLLSKSADQRPQTALAVCRSLRAAGATYPFEKLLRPKYLLEAASEYQVMMNSLPGLSTKQTRQLEMITAKSPSRLRLTLESNFRKGIVSITENGPALSGNVYWPNRLRRLELEQFSRRSLREKRTAVCDAATNTDSTNALTSLLLPLLRPSTIKRFALRAAPLAERENRHASATQLYLRAGDLESADRCAYQAASLLRGEHRAKEAIFCLNSVLDFAALTGKIAQVRELLMLRGDIQKETGEVDDALATYQSLVALYRDLSPDKLLAETYRDLGDLYKMKQDSKSGLDALNQAVTIYQQMGEEFELSRTYNNIGNAYFYAGDLGNTLRYYRSALRIQRRLNAPTEVASTLSNMGSVYCLVGNLTRGTFLLEKSLELKKELGDAGEIARTLNNLGYLSYLRGMYDRGIEQLQESLEINQRIGSQKEILYNLENLTMVLLEAGHLRDALKFLNQGLALAVELNHRPHQIAFQHSLSQVQMRLGKPREFVECLEKIESLMQHVEDLQWNVQIPLTKAMYRLMLNDREQALELTHAALSVAIAQNVKPLQLAAEMLRSRIDPDPQRYEQTTALAKECGKSTDLLVALYNRAEALLEAGQLDDAQQLLPRLAELSEQIPHYIERPRLINVLIELMLQRGDLAKARNLAIQNRDESRTFGLMPEHTHAITLLGMIESSNGNIEQAYANYRQALQIVKGIADGTTCDRDRSLFQEKRMVRFLVSEIRRLGQVLGQKQRAGHPALR
ncbi:MAG: tetratricopeptide repeat protein [bacterium]|nr:tetratricopeptide repeat protein [bacterium]